MKQLTRDEAEAQATQIFYRINLLAAMMQRVLVAAVAKPHEAHSWTVVGKTIEARVAKMKDTFKLFAMWALPEYTGDDALDNQQSS